MGEHGGTHVDAPYHFYKDGWHIDEIPMSHFIDVQAVVIDVEDEVNTLANPAEFQLLPSHIVNYEKQGRYIPERGVVLVHTGWSKYWSDKTKYLGVSNTTTEDGGEKISLQFPGLHNHDTKLMQWVECMLYGGNPFILRGT